MYQSLTGVNYTLDSAKQQLARSSSTSGGVTRFNILLQDTCFTTKGTSCHRFIIDSVLDERFFNNEIKDKSSQFAEPLQTVARFFFFGNCDSCSSFALNVLGENQLEEEYKALIEEIMKFNKSYVYFKGSEIHYANQCKSLCNKFDMVI